MKTIDDFKNEVAKDYLYKDWCHLEYCHIMSYRGIEPYLNEAIKRHIKYRNDNNNI